MRVEYLIFAVVGLFLGGAAIAYGAWTAYQGPIEWAGTLVLGLSAGLCAICALYFWIVSRRIVPRPEDRTQADVAEGAGEIGFFSPASFWPVGVAAATWAASFGVVVMQWWLLCVGLAGVLATVAGLLFEYYTGSRR